MFSCSATNFDNNKLNCKEIGATAQSTNYLEFGTSNALKLLSKIVSSGKNCYGKGWSATSSIKNSKIIQDNLMGLKKVPEKMTHPLFLPGLLRIFIHPPPLA